MTAEELFGKAKWAATGDDCASPCFRKVFFAPAFRAAHITVCGLGFFEMYLNGERFGSDLLVPAFSQYEKRELPDYPGLKLNCRIYALRYDVTRKVQNGENAIAFLLGKGWYDRRGSRTDGVSFGRPKLCFRLELENEDGSKGEILSDETLRWAESEITFNDIYGGEVQDGLLSKPGFSGVSYDASAWKEPVFVPAPDSSFFVQTCPPDRAVRKVSALQIGEVQGEVIFDAQESVSGFLTVRALKDGGEVTVSYADALKEDGSLDFYPTGGDKDRLQRDVFRHTKKGKLYFPHFCWHGFRYISVKGEAEAAEVSVVHADCPVTSTFDCDVPVLNWLYKTYLRTQLDNMHCGVPSDCPHIERLGYTGDGQLCAESAMLLLDSREFYRKWMQDIADSQEPNGHVQHTAPFMGGGGGPAGWGGAVVVVPYVYYRLFGEKEILREFLPRILRFFDYLVSRSENGLVVREENDWCLGDWCAPVEILLPKPHLKSKMLIPESYVNTALFIKFLDLACEMAKVIGEEEKTAKLPALKEQCMRMLKNAYYSPQTADFSGDVQGANAFALDIGMGTEETLRATAEKYRGRGMLDTGIFATDILLRVLFENGLSQLAFDLLTSDGEVSYSYEMKHGATTLWEDWHPERSLNHPMFGAPTRYLLTYFLGIGQEKDSAGFEKVRIAPCLVRGMNRASGSIETVRGKIAVSYVKEGESALFHITLSGGMRGRFVFGTHEEKLTQGETQIRVPLPEELR